MDRQSYLAYISEEIVLYNARDYYHYSVRSSFVARALLYVFLISRDILNFRFQMF
jgi:hypothetical protein